MPTSSEAGKAFIRAVIEGEVAKRNPTDQLIVLDVGVGEGTYWARLKDVLPASRTKWYGIEAWRPYIIQYGLEDKYYRIYNLDVRTYVRCLSYIGYPSKIDFAILGDVVEHMSKADALLVIQELFRVSDTIIVSLPVTHWPQGEVNGNPFEAHVKDDWTHEEAMASFPKIAGWAVEDGIGVYILKR